MSQSQQPLRPGVVADEDLVLQNRLSSGAEFYDKDFDWTPYAPRRRFSSSALQALKLSPFDKSTHDEKLYKKQVRFQDSGDKIRSPPDVSEADTETDNLDYDSGKQWWSQDELLNMRREAAEEAENIEKTTSEIVQFASRGRIPCDDNARNQPTHGLESLIFPMIQKRRQYVIRLTLATQGRLGKVPHHVRWHIIAAQYRQSSRDESTRAHALAKRKSLDNEEVF
jgi:hypothetical protein